MCKYILDVTMNSTKVVTEALFHNNVAENKLEPNDYHGSNINISQQTEATSDNSELLQNTDKSSKKTTGEFLLDY